MSAPEGPLASWIHQRAVGAWMRSALPLDGALVAVVLAPGVIPPELEGATWRTVEGVRVAAAPLARAVELARGRSRRAGDHVEAPAPVGCAWCLHLTHAGADVFGFPLVASGPADA